MHQTSQYVFDSLSNKESSLIATGECLQSDRQISNQVTVGKDRSLNGGCGLWRLCECSVAPGFTEMGMKLSLQIIHIFTLHITHNVFFLTSYSTGISLNTFLVALQYTQYVFFK